MTAGFVLAVVSFWPVFTWLGDYRDDPVMLTALVWYMMILVTMVYGPLAAFLVELFSCLNTLLLDVAAHHIGAGVSGGGVPFIATWLSGLVVGVPLIGLLYLMTIAAIGAIVSAVGLRRETHQVQIWDEVTAPRTH